VIVTTSLSLVVITTVFFGSTVGLVSNLLFKQDLSETHQALLEDTDSESHEKSGDQLHPNLEVISNIASERITNSRNGGESRR